MAETEDKLLKGVVHPLSVVIPTLGGESLRGTIEQLNRGTLIPSEILVCIPEEDAFRVHDLCINNVILVKTKTRGQVVQRAAGFEFAKHKIVLQLDDDISIHKEAIQELTNALQKLGTGNALGPIYFDENLGHCVHDIKSGLSGYLRSQFYSVICGAPWNEKRMGVMTKIGLCFGVDKNYCNSEYFKTEWLPGGCVLCFKEDLIKENFFPFPGKAYSEDIIHSFLRKDIGIQHWVIPGAECITNTMGSETLPSLILAEIRARRYFVELCHGPVWRLTLYENLSRIKRVLSKIVF